MAYAFRTKAGFALDKPTFTVTPTDIDHSLMCCTAVISTPALDRQGEILEPDGLVLDDYTSNPVVLYDHRVSWPLPIGIAEDDGGCTVQKSGDAWVSKNYFSQSCQFAGQCFRLMDEGILRGWSVGFDPVAGEPIGMRPDGKGKAFRYTRWKLIEQSLTPTGVNPEALTVYVEKSMVGSEPMHPKLKASLERLKLPGTETILVPAGVPQGTKAMPNAMSATDQSCGGALVKPPAPEKDKKHKDEPIQTKANDKHDPNTGQFADKGKKKVHSEGGGSTKPKLDKPLPGAKEHPRQDQMAGEEHAGRRAATEKPVANPSGHPGHAKEKPNVLPTRRNKPIGKYRPKWRAEGNLVTSHDKAVAHDSESVSPVEKSMTDTELPEGAAAPPAPVEPGMEGKKMKPSARKLLDCIQQLTDCAAAFSDGMDDLEHEGVVSTLHEALEALAITRDELTDSLGTHHPDVKADVPAMPGADEGMEDKSLPAEVGADEGHPVDEKEPPEDGHSDVPDENEGDDYEKKHLRLAIKVKGWAYTPARLTPDKVPTAELAADEEAELLAELKRMKSEVRLAKFANKRAARRAV